MYAKKFSKDPKIEVITLDSFLEDSDYLLTKNISCWDDIDRPKIGGYYYKVTPNYFVFIKHTEACINFGTMRVEKLETIEVAYRDGKTEYELFDRRIDEVQEKRNKYKRNIRLDAKIKRLNEVKNLMPKYPGSSDVTPKKFESYIENTGYKTSNEKLKNKYLVFDVETNGVRKSNDDLLSISIYDPSTGICYNRYFPLELQPIILTTFINGITDETLKDATHMTQDELNQVLEFFHAKDRILLSYSGGEGKFDSTFVINYCKRHNISGFEELQYENIKSRFILSNYGSEGQLSKDNLCQMFHIEGVKDIHSGLNDCILEWKLFEKIVSKCVFFCNQHLYKYKPGYIVPFSYLSGNPRLAEAADIEVPYLTGIPTKVFEYSLPKNAMSHIKKFPTNITGITIENAINSLLEVEKQDNYSFLLKNRRKLEYIGSLENKIYEIPITEKEDGTIESLEPENNEYIGVVNEVTKVIMQNMAPLISFIKNTIFQDDKILSQELNISSDGKVLAISDLSSPKAVIEIKTYGILNQSGNIFPRLATQLYYQAKGRETFVLAIEYVENSNSSYFDRNVKAVNMSVYKVELQPLEYKPRFLKKNLLAFQAEILNIIINNPSVTPKEILQITKYSKKNVSETIKRLINFGYIMKKEKKENTPWTILQNYDNHQD